MKKAIQKKNSSHLPPGMLVRAMSQLMRMAMGKEMAWCVTASRMVFQMDTSIPRSLRA